MDLVPLADTAAPPAGAASSRRLVVGRNDLETLHPEVAAQWAAEGNSELRPCDVTAGSTRRVVWTCPKGHRHIAAVQTKVRRRASTNKGCGVCANIIILKGYNDLASQREDLASEWDLAKNENVHPDEVGVGTAIKYWWKCENGHSFDLSPVRRSKGDGCYYCSGRRAIPGQTDLGTVRPAVAVLWHPTRNESLRPTDVLPYSSKSAWWLCANGHSTQRVIARQTLAYEGGHATCSACSKRVLTVGVNDLATLRPDIAKWFHPTLNGSLTSSGTSPGSSHSMWWLCDLGHDWRSSPQTLCAAGSRGCPICAGRHLLSGFNDLATVSPTLAEEWHPDNAVGASSVLPSATESRLWRGRCGHSWEMPVADRYRRGVGCPHCSAGRFLRGFNDFATRHPVLAREWHPTMNGDVTPRDIAHSLEDKTWWLCPRGHSYAMPPARRKRGFGCSQCTGRTVSPGETDFATLHPRAASEWHPTKNGTLRPADVRPGSARRVWWVCSRGHEWPAAIASRAGGSGCTVCMGRKALAGTNDLTTTHPDVAKTWHPTKNGNLEPTQVVAGSAKRPWWTCAKGHVFQATVSLWVDGYGCKQCSKWGTSVPERLLFEALSGHLERPLNGSRLAVAWRQNTCRVDITGALNGTPVAIEYDGVFYHSRSTAFARDLDKTAALLAAGYWVVRVREKALEHLELDHPRLVQLNHDPGQSVTSARLTPDGAQQPTATSTDRRRGVAEHTARLIVAELRDRIAAASAAA